MIKNRMKEKGGIVKKAKGRGKIEMEITKKIKENFKSVCFFFPNQLLTTDAELEIIFHR